MMNNQQDAQEKQFLKRLQERAERVNDRYQEEATDYLEPRWQMIAETLLRPMGQGYLFCGGYEEAERKKLVLFPPYIDPDCGKAGNVLVKLSGNMAFVKADHRDFLGAIMSLGIKREKFGDVIVAAEGCYVLTTAEIADYLMLNCPRVKGVKMTAECVPFADWTPPQAETAAITALVPSLRIDTIAAHGFGLSRAKTMEMIREGKVQINHRETKETDVLCQEGDLISFRGKGRVKVAQVVGETKKGKLRVELIKYI